MENITLTSLIEEHKNRIPHLKYIPDPPNCIGFAYYKYEDSEDYQTWLAKTKRFIGINFPKDKDVQEFGEISEKKLSPTQQKQLLAILEALSCLPNVICPDNSSENKESRIHITNNINNSNSQSQNQEQTVAINLFLEAIKDDLTGKQVKELKDILAECESDKPKAWKRIVEKLKSFGSDVASNIVANILTNPVIWNSFVN